MTKTGYTTHEQGAWKWRARFALNQYVAVARKSDGVWIWKKVRELNGKVKLADVGPRCKHAQPLTENELYLLTQI